MDKVERVESDRVNSQFPTSQWANTDLATSDRPTSQRVWGTRKADAAGIAHTVVEQLQTKMQTQLQTKIQAYLHSNPPDYRFQVDSLLELLYIAFTGYNITETPELKAKLEPLEQKLRSLAWAAAQGQLQSQSQPVQMARATPDDQPQDQLQGQPQAASGRPQNQLKTTPDQPKMEPQAQRLIDEVADEYMNYVYGMCAAYERQSYIEGIKVGARLMMELMR